TRENGKWEPWILYMLESISETAKETILLINEIKKLMLDYKQQIRSKLPKIYGQDLLNNLFRHPYTKIEYIMEDLDVTRATATRYLTLLTEIKILEKIKIGRNNYYLNGPLFALLKDRISEK